MSTKKTNQRRKRVARIKRGDTVIVISGKEKGSTGKVLLVDWKNERVLVEGVNMVTKHVKPNPQNQDGGRVQQEAPLHYSNIQLYNASLERGVRFRTVKTDSGEKQRICVKTSEVLG